MTEEWKWKGEGYKRRRKGNSVASCIVSWALQKFWIKEIAPIHLRKMGIDEDVWLKYIVCNGDESHIHGIELCHFNLPLEPGCTLSSKF